MAEGLSYLFGEAAKLVEQARDQISAIIQELPTLLVEGYPDLSEEQLAGNLNDVEERLKGFQGILDRLDADMHDTKFLD